MENSDEKLHNKFIENLAGFLMYTFLKNYARFKNLIRTFFKEQNLF